MDQLAPDSIEKRVHDFVRHLGTKAQTVNIFLEFKRFANAHITRTVVAPSLNVRLEIVDLFFDLLQLD